MNKRIQEIVASILSLILGLSPSLSLAYPMYSSRPGSPPKGTRAAFSATLRQVPKNNRAWTSSKLVGQTETVLPSGRSLLIGGQGPDGPQRTASISNGRTGEITPLTSGLRQARAWHSATILPDGRVLVLGGIGADGNVVDDTEIFDPETQIFQPLAPTDLTPRAYHTATLLTDGHVLIVGGTAKNGRALSNAELWDPESNAVTRL